MNLGDRLLNYEILAPLGTGGLGEVYLARDVNLEINVAVKVLHPDLSKSETMLHRLRVGARAAARLRHPNIQTVHYLGRDPATGVDFVVMEYLSGGTLRQRITFGRLPVDEALGIFSIICTAMDFAHRHGVVHRDLKPDNVMYDAEGKLVVTDFDLARVTGEMRRTRAGQALGTLLYISPEQARGDDVDHTTDVYSLGVILFELMTGRWPFMGQTDIEIINGHLTLPPPRPGEFNPDVPPHVDQAVLRALAKTPAERFQSAGELDCAAHGRAYAPTDRPAAGPVAEPEAATPSRPPPPVAAPMREASLRVLNGAQAGQRFLIGAGVSIGYGKSRNDVHLEDEYVSRAHARIDRRGEVYQLMDLKSTNGTTVNGRQVEAYSPVVLLPGDEIEVGDTLLAFEAADASPM